MDATELRALADALEPMAKAPRFEDFDVPGFCEWVRACADEKPVGYVTANGLRSLRHDDATVLLYAHDYLIRPDHVALYTHPAPQPQPKKCGCRSCLTPAERLCTFVVCPECGDKRCPRADDHRNACSNSNAPGQVPQPERQPVSEATNEIEPTDAHPMLCATHYCKDCAALWRQCDDFSFTLRSQACCTACNNAPVGGQLFALTTPVAMPRPSEPTEAQIEASQAALGVLAERRRQVEAEGWTPAHDDEHIGGQMAMAAACYAAHAAVDGCIHCTSEDTLPALAVLLARAQSFVATCWPWSPRWWKPKDRRRNLVKAGALILAEIERLDRAALAAKDVK